MRISVIYLGLGEANGGENLTWDVNEGLSDDWNAFVQRVVLKDGVLFFVLIAADEELGHVVVVNLAPLLFPNLTLTHLIYCL